jgi:hypothetical protein
MRCHHRPLEVRKRLNHFHPSGKRGGLTFPHPGPAKEKPRRSEPPGQVCSSSGVHGGAPKVQTCQLPAADALTKLLASVASKKRSPGAIGATIAGA